MQIFVHGNRMTGIKIKKKIDKDQSTGEKSMFHFPVNCRVLLVWWLVTILCRLALRFEKLTQDPGIIVFRVNRFLLACLVYQFLRVLGDLVLDVIDFPPVLRLEDPPQTNY